MDKKPSEATLRVQLQELNQRSRWYTSRLWQIPFAYIGIASTYWWASNSSSSYINKGLPIFMIALGIIVWDHINDLGEKISRAVDNIQRVEGELQLEVTAKKSGKSVRRFKLIVFATVLLFFCQFVLEMINFALG